MTCFASYMLRVNISIIILGMIVPTNSSIDVADVSQTFSLRILLSIRCLIEIHFGNSMDRDTNGQHLSKDCFSVVFSGVIL